MSTNEIARPGVNAGAPVAKDAPTEQQASQPGAPKRFEKGQTVCNEKNEKGKLHNGHLKQVSPIREEARQHMRGDDLLYRCQTCGTLYMGPPLGHVRDPRKQARYVQSELVDILEAAGGTLPAFKKSETGAWVPVGQPAPHAAPAASAAPPPAKPATATPAAAPAVATTASATDGETPEQKRARIIAEAKAKAATRMAGGANAQSDAAAAPSTPTASPAPSAPDGETADERRARMMAEVKAKAAARMAGKAGEPPTPKPPATNSETAATNSETATTGSETVAASPTPAAAAAPPVAPTAATAPPVPSGDETAEEKRARQMAEIKAKAAARMAAKNSSGGAKTGGETSIAMPPTTAQPPSPTSGTDSSTAADAHRPAAEAQAATGQASAAPLSPAAATASPAAGAETPADLAPDASTELTPGAPRDERAADDEDAGG
ncbi:MAG TPA: hypothetical protein VF703_17430 [Pyrinomonadaceae bacterium]|jgi:hypothetical protein